MNNQGQDRPEYGRCTLCKGIGPYGTRCDRGDCEPVDGTRPHCVEEINELYRHDLFHLGITTQRESSSYTGNCGACYRQGIKGYRCLDCNREILNLVTLNEDVVDSCFAATYYRQFTAEPRDISERRMEPMDPNAGFLDVFAAAYSDDMDALDPTAATRGLNGTVGFDVEEDMDEEMENEDQYGENVPLNDGNVPENGTNGDDQDMDDQPYARRRQYYQQPEPALGSDAYILELILEVRDMPNESRSNQDDDVEDDDEEEETLSPLEALTFNEVMYRRLRIMATRGNLGHFGDN